MCQRVHAFVKSPTLLHLPVKHPAGIFYLFNSSLSLKKEVFLVRTLHLFTYRKIPKISPGAYLFQRLFLKIDWASLIVGSKFTVFASLYFVFEGNFPSTSPGDWEGGAYIWRGDLTEGFFALLVWGAYTWRGLFSEFYGTSKVKCSFI